MLKQQKWEKKMKSYLSVCKTAASLLLVGALTACGGGGGDPAPAAAVVAPTSFTVTGTAASGAPFDGAIITVFDSKGNSYPKAGDPAIKADALGVYSITLPLTATPPFVVQATRTDPVTNAPVTLVSVVAEAKDTNTNITPITNLIASRLSPSGDPTNLAAELKATPTLFTAKILGDKVSEIAVLIKPLTDAVGNTTDPLNGKLTADGTGNDKVLDSLKISITPSSATAGATSADAPVTTGVNIEISVKQVASDTAPIPVIALGGGANTKPTTGALDTDPTTGAPITLKDSDLLPKGTATTNATLIADLLPRMTACYALALTDRVNATATTAADITAPACRTLFVGDDPASFKSNGFAVSSTGSFKNIFTSAGNGLKFDGGSYEFTRDNGDVVIAYRATDSLGNSTYNTLMVRTEAGKFKAIGNQNRYSGGVSAYHQLRTFVNQPAATYYSTGYSLSVNNTLDTSGQPIFAKVVVTPPKGNAVTLVPAAGSSTLLLQKSSVSATGVITNSTSATSFLRIRNVYADANNPGDPAKADTAIFAVATPMSDADIALIAAQSSWKFEYYLASSPTTVDATQYFKTRARAMTIAELQTQPLATLTADATAFATTNTKSIANCGNCIATPPTGAISLAWVVPTLALAPTSIQAYGASPVTVATSTVTNGKTVTGTAIIRLAWSDNATVLSSARTGDITCSPATKSDAHCNAGNFVAGGVNGFHLWASDPAGREFASFFATYSVVFP